MTEHHPELLHVVADHAALPGWVDASSCAMLDAVLYRLGPTATVLLWMHLAKLVAAGPADVRLRDLAVWSGVLEPVAWKSLNRLALFGCAAFPSTDVIVVRLWDGPWVVGRSRHLRGCRESVPR